MNRKYISLLAIVGAAFLFSPSASFAQPFPPEPTVPLGNATSFGVLGGSTVTNTGATVVNGDLGVSPGSAITGAPVVTGATFTGAASFAGQAQASLTAAMIDAAGRTCDLNLTGTDLGAIGVPLTPGVYCFSSAAFLTGTLTLDFQGNPNAVFIFKIGTGLTTATGSTVALINAPGTTCPPNVFFQVGSSAVLFTGTTFVGNILADQSITLQTGSTLRGRALASIGAVNLSANTVTACGAVVIPPGGPPGGNIPTLDFYGLAILVVLLAGAGMFLVNRLSI